MFIEGDELSFAAPLSFDRSIFNLAGISGHPNSISCTMGHFNNLPQFITTLKRGLFNLLTHRKGSKPTNITP